MCTKRLIPNEVDEKVINGFSEMVVKIDKPESQCTLHEVRKLNKAIIKDSHLCSHSVYIGAVSRNCVVVRLRFPSSAVGWVLAAITPDFMTTHRLTEFAVDGHPLSLIQAQSNNLNNELIAAAVRDEDVMRVVSLLNSGADIQTKDWLSQTPLEWASRYGHLQVVRLLISRGAQLNHQDEVRQ
ncbi:Ankyrin repeat domain-containing protein 23, partial [Geodia barretti]